MSMPPPPPPPPPAAASADGNENVPVIEGKLSRSNSISQKSEDSQTAAEFIRDQMQLEADAREALPYSIENCTKPLGPLRQNVFACLTCHPPPKNPDDSYTPAGVCYSCSVQCHGEHTLVEIFAKRNFTCDCGTTRFPSTSPCSLRLNPDTNVKGGVHSEEPDPNNIYNQNFRNRFCSCECDYDPFKQKGTMFQCLGLGTHETGGCGEDWYHPGCLVGLGPNWFEASPNQKAPKPKHNSGALPAISENTEEEEEDEEEDDIPPPPGFPDEDEFEGFVCYKCVEAHPWIKKYAGAPGFLPPVFLNPEDKPPLPEPVPPTAETTQDASSSKKRKADDDEETSPPEVKRAKTEEAASPAPAVETVATNTVSEVPPAPTEEDKDVCKAEKLPPGPEGKFSLFFTESFRSHLCHCSSCFPHLRPHEQLLEEEETYQPPISEDGSDGGGSSLGSGSLLDRGESALRNVDRVRAIEGVMAYNHLKDKLKPFFQQFAESGEAISADHIKEYFAKLRGDDQAIREAGEMAKDENGDGDGESDNRREQSGY